MSSSTLAIIIPVYNVEKFVNETLLSIKDQKEKADEIIVINDGSTDGSFNIINNFSNLKGWKILQTINQGLGLTRNYGLSIAKSEYVYFLDSDDIVEKNFVYEIKKLINKFNKPDMILFSGNTFQNKSNSHKNINLKFSINGQFFKGDKLLTKLVKKKETLPQASRYITKKGLWISNNLKYPKGIAEDETIFFPLIASSDNTIINKKSYYRYRLNRPGSITSEKVRSEHARDYFDRVVFTLDFMESKYDLVKFDYSAWCYNLERKCLKYINLCLKTKQRISWQIIIKIILKTKNFLFLLKIIFRIIKNISK